MSEIADWYLFRRGRRYGPGPLASLRARSGNDGEEPHDMIWRPGMEAWVYASQAGSFSAVIVTPATSKPPAAPNYVPRTEETSPGGITPADKDARLRASAEKGIRGWLILLGVVLFASGLRNLITFLQETNVLSGGLSEAERQYVYVTLIWSGVLSLAWFYLLIPFFGRRSSFPAAFSIVMGLTIVSAVASPFVALAMIKAPITAEDSGNMARTIVLGLLWLTYVLISRRVQYTFIR